MTVPESDALNAELQVPQFRIVSGGQTGVDRAALDAAMSLGIPCGGWCPRGRRAEDGPIPDRYPLTETKSAKYAVRTRRNVRDSEGTLILAIGEPTGGTELTVDIATRRNRPCLVVSLNEEPEAAAVAEWIAANRITALNVAGPRESTAPGVHATAVKFLVALLSALPKDPVS